MELMECITEILSHTTGLMCEDTLLNILRTVLYVVDINLETSELYSIYVRKKNYLATELPGNSTIWQQSWVINLI